MKCAQCQKERPDAEVVSISATVANVMTIAHMFLGTHHLAKRNPGLFPRRTGDFVCRECRLVSIIVLVFAATLMSVMIGTFLWVH
jgi:hypothetical protein